MTVGCVRELDIFDFFAGEESACDDDALLVSGELFIVDGGDGVLAFGGTDFHGGGSVEEEFQIFLV